MVYRDEDLVGVYNTGEVGSSKHAMRDIVHDLRERGVHQAILSIDLTKEGK